MKKVLKKIVFISVFLTIAFFTSNIYVDANTINSVTMDIFLNKDGSGHVTEVWDMNLNEGTESYKPYGNLKNYKIKNFVKPLLYIINIDYIINVNPYYIVPL